MPANLPVEYFKLEREYWKVNNKKEKIKILKQMLGVIPKHKGTERIIGEIRRRISKLKEEIKSEEKRKKSIGRKVGIKKEGAGQVVLVGYPNSGKSYLMNKLCNMELKSTNIPFETKRPEVGMMDYKGIKIQLIEIPSYYDGFEEKKKMLMGIIKNADMVVFLNDGIADKMKTKKFIVINSKQELDSIKEKIWRGLNKIIVYTKEPNKKRYEPIAMKPNSTIKDLGKQIHKDFVNKFKYARVIHKKVVKRVGLNYKLEDGDIVEFHLR